VLDDLGSAGLGQLGLLDGAETTQSWPGPEEMRDK
jgi:hypothetical protein